MARTYLIFGDIEGKARRGSNVECTNPFAIKNPATGENVKGGGISFSATEPLETVVLKN